MPKKPVVKKSTAKPIAKKSATKTVVAKKPVVKKTVKKAAFVQPVATNVTFVQAVHDYWFGYFDFRGLTSRRGFWWAFLFCWIFGMIGGAFGGFIDVALALSMFLPSMALGVRRYHDAGFSGWWYVLLGLGQSVLWLYVLAGFANEPSIQQVYNTWPLLTAEFVLWCVNMVILLLPSKITDNKYRK